jgi:S1-C subfamily serine protease
VLNDISDAYDLAYLSIYSAYSNSDGETYGTFPSKLPALYDDDGRYASVCGSSAAVTLGQSVRIFGYPASTGPLHLAVTDGIISSVLDGGLLATSAKIDSGNSGGLAVDSRGCIIGVPSAVLMGTYDKFGIIIPMAVVRQFEQKASEVMK